MNEKHILTHMSLLDAQVCSIGTYDEALEFIQTLHPAGTGNNWQKNPDPLFKPVTCSEFPERTHYMFVC